MKIILKIDGQKISHFSCKLRGLVGGNFVL